MKHVHLLAGSIAAVALVACAGSGSSSSGSSSSPTGTTISGTPRIEAVVLNPTTYDNGSQSDGQTFIIQDPEDIETQDQVQFELVEYSTTGARIVLPAAAWTTTDTTNTYGQIGYNSGVYVANQAQTQTPLVVSVNYLGKIYNANYDIVARQARLRGLILDDKTHKPVPGVEVDFYGLENPEQPAGPGNAEVFRSRVITAYDGTFRASVPGGVTVTDGNGVQITYAAVDHFTLVNNTIPTNYQRFFRWDNQFWNTGNASCGAPTAPHTYVDGEYFFINYADSNINSNGTILLVPQSESTPDVPCAG